MTTLGGRPYHRPRHQDDYQEKAAFRRRSVAVFILGYAGIAPCEFREGTQSDDPLFGNPPLRISDS
jgi:hypothetical protein